MIQPEFRLDEINLSNIAMHARTVNDRSKVPIHAPTSRIHLFPTTPAAALKRKATVVRVVPIDLVAAVASEFGHTAALDTPEMLADLSGLVLSSFSVNALGEQGAVGALSNAITLDHVGVE